MGMRPCAEVLPSGEFLVTTELNPPQGTTLAPLLAHAEQLSGVVDAFNLTDSHSSRMRMAPQAVARLLLERGMEPVLQITCRDRNRLALQSDLLAAAALGVRNLVCMTGDPPGTGDHLVRSVISRRSCGRRDCCRGSEGLCLSGTDDRHVSSIGHRNVCPNLCGGKPPCRAENARVLSPLHAYRQELLV